MTESEMKGFAFEQFVDAHFLAKYFKRLEWRSDIKGQDGRLSESSKYPDLEYEILKNGHRFAVECKWRSKVIEDSIKIMSHKKQLLNYQEYSKSRNMDVIIVLGIGGTPESPKDLYSIPLGDITDIKIPLEQLNFYQIDPIPESFYFVISKHNLQLKNGSKSKGRF